MEKEQEKEAKDGEKGSFKRHSALPQALRPG